MAIGTYAQLKTAVAGWLHRSDLTTQIVDFISLTEAAIRRDLRVREMEASTTSALTSTTLAIPSDFLEVREVILDNVVLDYVPPATWYPWREEETHQYTVLGTNFVFQRSAGTFKIDYYKPFTSFSADGDTNWLLTNHPDIYLFGALFEATAFTRDDPSIWRGKYLSALDRIRTTQRNSIGPLVVRPAGYTP